jgi:RNA polymerase sigma factor (TIGR02999 family)
MSEASAPTSPLPTVTALLAEARNGDPTALGRLIPLVYEQLRELARIQRRRMPETETLNTTALVHEAFVRLDGVNTMRVNDRAHFMALSATVMRHILIGHARRKAASKRGGGLDRISFAQLDLALVSESGFTDAKAEALVALDSALCRLSQRSERQRRVVECRFFGGMSVEETSIALDVSPATVKRDWSIAQAWLHRELEEALQ